MSGFNKNIVKSPAIFEALSSADLEDSGGVEAKIKRKKGWRL